ncbi:MAG: hypothetical protein J5676_05600 [Bacteroidaceae bacterium]|nr:hypothetical protein [Bacteroidaceae bacterium]
MDYKLLITAGLLTMQNINAQTPADSCRITNTADSLHFIVVNIETGVPIRDILVHTNDNQKTQSRWDGTFALHNSYKSMTLTHPAYEKRTVYKEKLKSDTIFMLTNSYALDEVVIYGHSKSKDLKFNLSQQKHEIKMMQQIQQGVNVGALLGLAFHELWGKKIQHRQNLKRQKRKALIENY